MSLFYRTFNRIKKMDEALTCPNCGSEQVTTQHHQTFMANTGDHYCHSMKTQDSDSPAGCLDCDWRGERKDLVVVVR